MPNVAFEAPIRATSVNSHHSLLTPTATRARPTNADAAARDGRPLMSRSIESPRQSTPGAKSQIKRLLTSRGAKGCSPEQHRRSGSLDEAPPRSESTGGQRTAGAWQRGQ
jgi:hypothetical protein